MRTRSRDEVQFDPATRPAQPSLHQFGVVVAGVVHKQMDQPLAGIHCLDRPQQQQGIGPPRQSVRHRPISGQFNQVYALQGQGSHRQSCDD